jgi:outer membrane lipoprotein-sorting protein
VFSVAKSSASQPSRARRGLNAVLLWGLLALFLLIPAGVAAQTTNAPATVSLEEIGRALGKAETVFTHFVQERHLSLFAEPLRTEGYLGFQRPGRLRWEITSPYKSILVSDGSGVAQFEWVEEKWKKLDIGLADALQNVITQIAAVMEGRYATQKRDYEVSLANDAEGPVVTLVPRREMMRKVMQAIEVHLAPDLRATRRVVLREKDGDFTDIRFSGQVVGLAFPAQTFDRSAPLPLDAIRQAAAKKPGQT